jgi:hypothetical protein
VRRTRLGAPGAVEGALGGLDLADLVGAGLVVGVAQIGEGLLAVTQLYFGIGQAPAKLFGLAVGEATVLSATILVWR